MKIRYRETDKTVHFEFRDEEVQSMVLVGRGDPFYLDEDAMPDPDDEYFVGPDTFDEWETVEATDEELHRFREAGFPDLPPQPLIIQGV